MIERLLCCVQVIWCEALFKSAGGLGINFAAEPNARGRLCFTVYHVDPVMCKVWETRPSFSFVNCSQRFPYEN
jgi:hypothetical protein